MEQGYTVMSNTNNASDSLRMDGFTSVTFVPGVSYANDLTATTSPLPPVPRSSGSTCTNRKHDHDYVGSFPRVDSGFESSLSSPSREDTALDNRASSSTYEYINPRDLYLHPLPFTKSSGESDSSARTTATVTTTTTTCSFQNTDCDVDDSQHSQSGTRHRSNPIYHSVQISGSQVHTKQQMRLQKQLCCLWIAVTVLILTTVLVLVLSAYTLFGAVADLQSHIHRKDKRIQSLESEYLTLSKKIKSMNYIQTGNSSYLAETGGETLYIMEAQSYFGRSLENLTSQIQDINSSLHRQIQNISQIPGPQGPSGIDNLSLCQYFRLKSSVALGGGSSSTSYVPAPGDLENNIVMSVACDVRGGTQQSVEVNVLSENKLQYRCRCDGEKPGESHRECIIHYLLCPRFS